MAAFEAGDTFTGQDVFLLLLSISRSNILKTHFKKLYKLTMCPAAWLYKGSWFPQALVKSTGKWGIPCPWRHVWSLRNPFFPSPFIAPIHWLRLPSNNQGLHGGLNDKMKASCVSVEVLMTFRAAVEMLGSVQTHSACCTKTKKGWCWGSCCKRSILVFVNVAIDCNNDTKCNA